MHINRLLIISAFAMSTLGMLGCGPQPGVTNGNLVRTGTNNSNSQASSLNNSNTTTAAPSAVDTKEPDQYQATVTLKLEAVGGGQTTSMPTLSSTVARDSKDRRMEFTMPAGGRVVFLDKAGTNYLILPEKKQYAELNRESLGFDVRRMLMPEQIVQSVKNVPGMERVGEEKYNGRDVVKYRYAAVAKTQSQAGQVETESFLLVDKATGLPLRSETVSQTQSGANIKGYSGLRVITEITDIKTETPAGLFDMPTDFQKIDSAQVRSQVDLIFSALGAFLTQIMQQGQGTPGTTASPGR